MIDNIVAIVTSNTILLVLTILIGIMIVISIVKRFLRLFLIAVIVLALYAGYLSYTGQKVPTSSKEILEHGSGKLEELKKEAVKQQLKEKGIRALDELQDR